MEEDFARERHVARFRTSQAEIYSSKEVLQSQEKLGDTPETRQHKPETNTKDVTSDMTEEPLAGSESPTDEMSIYHPNNDETETSDTDDPNLSGLSHLDPDPSLGCLPRGFVKRRSTTQTYVAPEEMPQLRAWNYLLKRNIIELFEDMTADIFFNRFPSPIDYMIEATAKARLKNQQDDHCAEESSSQKRIAKDRNAENASADILSAKDVSRAARESGSSLLPSQQDYIDDVIHVAAQYDVSSSATRAEAAKQEDAKDADKDDVSVYAPPDEADDVKSFRGKMLASDDDADQVTCFTTDESRPVELEFETQVEERDVKSPADEDNSLPPRVITSTEAFRLMSYLS